MVPTTGYSAVEVEELVTTVSTRMKASNLNLLMVSSDNAAAHQSLFAKLMEDRQQCSFPLIDWPFTYRGM